MPANDIAAESLPKSPTAVLVTGPIRVEPVSLQGKATEAGWVPENSQWRNQLLHIDEDGCLAGRNPMAVPIEVLNASGHPHRTAQQVFSAWGGCLVDNPARGPKGVREHCLACAESQAEVRRCQIYNCPCWPYRMGRNPHDERRGKTPVFRAPHRQNSRARVAELPDSLPAHPPSPNEPTGLGGGPAALPALAASPGAPLGLTGPAG